MCLSTLNVVVISQNQREHINPMLRALSGNNVCYVLDRCTDGSENELKNTMHIVNDSGQGFLAGKMRDLGAWCFGYKGPILLLDGDKTPLGPLPDFEALGFDCVMLGVENDPRGLPDGQHSLNKIYNSVYSCGIWINQKVIDKAREICDGRIFHAAFDGNWGDEDRFLGNIIRHYGFTVGYCSNPKLSGTITGIDENTSDSKMQGFAKNFYTRLQLIKELDK